MKSVIINSGLCIICALCIYCRNRYFCSYSNGFFSYIFDKKREERYNEKLIDKVYSKNSKYNHLKEIKLLQILNHYDEMHCTY